VLRKKNCILAWAITSTMAGLSPLLVRAAESEPVDLGSITVKGEGMREADRAFSVNSISQEQINAKHSESPISLIEEAPGVDVVAYQQGGVADVFSLRGFTGGGHGSDVAVSLDGINLNEGESHADGYADTNLLIPLELESVTVFKGPVSPLYGNFARGGVVAFNTRKGGEYQDIDVSMGSYGTFDAQAAMGGKFGPLQLNTALQGYESEGWRDNSRYTKMNASFRAAYNINDATEVALSLRGHGGHWQAPGYILNDQFEDESRRREQDPNVATQQDTGDKQFSGQRIDFNHILSDDLKLLAFVYNTDSVFTRFQTGVNINNPPAVQQVEHHYERDVIALGASLNGKDSVAGIPSNWVAGFEYYDEDTLSQRWNDAVHVRQTKLLDDNFTNNTASLYGQMDLDINPRFRPTLGVRYDNFGGERDNNLTGVNSDINDFDHISPKLGVRSALTDTWELRASAANGFALPGGTAKFDPAIDVDNVEYWQYEVGISGAPSSQWFFDLATFINNSSDEILQDPPGSGIFTNVGETRRSGVEGEIRYYPTTLEYVEIGTTFGIYDSEIRKNPDPTLVGKEISGLARHVANFDISYSPPTGFGASARLRSLGAWFTNAANTVEYDGHNVLNASLFYRFRTDDGRSARWYLDINNITDEVYSEIASGGPHPTQGLVPTTLSPMPPANVMVGVALSM
jgi:outer membrane receptor protein involved in Fe transport